MPNPFTAGQTVALPVTAASARVALPTGISDQLLITSATTGNEAFIAFGDVTVTSAVPSGTPAQATPVLPGSAFVLTIPPDATHVAAICAGGNTATLWFTKGQGQ